MHVNNSNSKSTVDHNAMVKLVDDCLPQTQCRQCGYAGCKPYAIAIVDGEADINQCPPGGEAGVRQLAKLMGVQYKPLNPNHGAEKPKVIAFIVEEACIGCTLCIQACPVDAILGASKMMHTVISQECTGCELCLPPCPVDCIVMTPPTDITLLEKPKKIFRQSKESGLQQLQAAQVAQVAQLAQQAQLAKDKARERYNFRAHRLARDQQESAQKQFERADLAKTIAAKVLQSVIQSEN